MIDELVRKYRIARDFPIENWKFILFGEIVLKIHRQKIADEFIVFIYKKGSKYMVYAYDYRYSHLKSKYHAIVRNDRVYTDLSDLVDYSPITIYDIDYCTDGELRQEIRTKKLAKGI